jgi:hypothetical protein
VIGLQLPATGSPTPTTKARWDQVESTSRFGFLSEHDLSENRYTLFRIML